MDTLETIHAVTVSNRCFAHIYNNLEAQQLLELEVHVEVNRSVQRTTEILLLKLTTIYRLFQLILSKRRSCRKINDICYYLINNNIIRKLVSCLKDTDHHIVFMTAKAISSLMLSVPLVSTVKTQLEGLFQNCNDSEWKFLYAINILKHVLESRAEDDANNVRMHSQKSLICNCVNTEPWSFGNEQKSSIELLDFIVTREWMSILPLYIPLWNEIFVGCIGDITENSKSTAVDLLEYHSKLASSTHQRMERMVVDCFDISSRSEQVFVSFLSFTAEFLNWTFRSCCNIDPQKDAMGGNIFSENLESKKEKFLLKIIGVMPHFLHVKKLSSGIWKATLQLLSFSLNTSTSTQNPQHCKQQTPSYKYTHHSATAFICAVNSGILDNFPTHTGFEGFGGSLVKPVKENQITICQTKGPNTGVFRQTSLLVVQAALVLLNTSENYKNAQLSQDIFKAINIWYGVLLEVGANDHGNWEACQKVSSNYDNQRAFHKQPSLILMDVFADQDDEMIHIMLLLLQLFKVSRKPAYQDATAILNTINPHLVFQAFLKVIGFDHSVLLDFLISSETVFLEYLMQYLHFVLRDWQDFCQNCKHLFQSTIITDDQTESIQTLRECRQIQHDNVRGISNSPDNKPASFPEGMVACNQANSVHESTISSLKGLDGLSNIFSAYGSDTEDDGDEEEEQEEDENFTYIRQSYPDDRQGYLEDIDIHNINTQEGIFSGVKVEINNGFNNDTGSDCVRESNYSNEGDNCGVYNSAWKDEKNQDDNDVNDINMGIDDIIHGGGDDKQLPCLARRMATDDVDVNEGGVDDDIIDDDEHDEISTSACSIQLQSDGLCPMLEKIMSTLIHTRIAAERLNEGSLFPYQVKPLIIAMKKIENLYDGC